MDFNNFINILDLRTTGIWVPWNATMTGVPKYAVISGWADHQIMYFARHDIYDENNKYHGKHIGRYGVGYDRCYIPFEEIEKEFIEFEVSN